MVREAHHCALMNEREKVAEAERAGSPMTTGCAALVALKDKAATGRARHGGATTQVSELLREPKAIETKKR